MPYLKDELSGFIPEEISGEIIKDVARGSSIIRLSKAEEMKTNEKKVPVMTSGAGAYWVGEGERIKTSGATWIYPKLIAKKLAVIIPVTKEKLEDTTIDVFSELRPSISEAFYKTIDAACIFGTDSPFETSLFGKISDAGNTISATDKIDIDVSDLMSTVEENGFDVNGFTATIGVKGTLRKLRDNNGASLFIEGTNQKEFYSQPIEFVRNGAWDKEKAVIIGGEWKYSLFGMKQGIEFEILKEATLQNTLDADGKPISLAEQDMVAIKATMRVGYLCVKENAFAAVVPAAETTPDTTLSSLSIGSLNLSPAFNKDTTAYTASTSNATNTITAVPSDSNAVVEIKVDETAVDNGGSATWASGENTVIIKVTNGSSENTYTIAVSKS